MGGMRLPVIPPGESIMLIVQFKAKLPGFAGDNLLNTDFLLPDEVITQFTLSHRYSVFDAKLNVRRATYQFFDRFRRPVTTPISVALENAICQKGIVSGQSFTIVSRFAGAASRRDIAHVQVTVFDDEGSSFANSFPSAFSAVTGSPVTAQQSPAGSAADIFTIVSPPLMRFPTQSRVISRQKLESRKPRKE